MLRATFVAGLTAGVLSIAAASAQETTLRFAHYAQPGDTAFAAAEMFKFVAEQMSDGALEISVHPAGELGNSPTMLEGARLGTIDLALVGNPYFTGFAPALNLLDLPFLFQSPAHAYAVLDGEVGATLMADLNQYGLQGLAFWELGFRNLTNNVRPIEGPDDLAGLKLRTVPNKAHVPAFEILGANPTPMPFSEVYSALQTGAIDGQENPVGHIYAGKLHEVQKHLSLTGHAYTAAPLVINRMRWEGLDEDARAALRVAALTAATYQRLLNAAEEAGDLEAMAAAGVQVVMKPDVAAFRERVAAPTREGYASANGSALLEQVDALAR